MAGAMAPFSGAGGAVVVGTGIFDPAQLQPFGHRQCLIVAQVWSTRERAARRGQLFELKGQLSVHRE